MKTEPDTFSFDDLLKAPGRTTSWEGVRNYMARNIMRDQMKVGDLTFFYHSSCEEPGIVGITEVVKEAHPDLTALDPKSEYYDEKSAKKGESQWSMVAVRAKDRMKHFVPLSELKATKGLEKMMVTQRGARLSVQPVTEAEWNIIVKLGKPEKI
jgi:predicted RNA-binding protein with PUA-like domain